VKGEKKRFHEEREDGTKDTKKSTDALVH